jgi:glycolate oxidase FAD binding subunit
MADVFEGIVGASGVRRLQGEALDGVPIETSVHPRSPAEVASCLAAAGSHRIALVVRGGGTKQGWGNRARADALVRLELGALREPLELQPEEGIATVAAGVRVDAVEEAAGAHGMRTLLDASRAGATVGGTIACDPVGLEYGLDRRLRGDLLGLEVALPNGTLTKCGGQVVKNVTGFDLVRLYCGSLGTLGVITRATLRVRPQPAAARVLVRECVSLEAAHAASAELVAERVEPSGVAIVSAPSPRLIWKIEGIPDDVAVRAARVRAEIGSESDWGALAQRIAEPAPGSVRVRLGGRSSDTLALARALEEQAGSTALVALLPLVGVAWADVPASSVGLIFEQCARAHWLLWVECADPDLKERTDVFGPEPAALPLMRTLKQRFDPEGVLAPGRFCGRL